jgi:hypothetical protein
MAWGVLAALLDVIVGHLRRYSPRLTRDHETTVKAAGECGHNGRTDGRLGAHRPNDPRSWATAKPGPQKARDRGPTLIQPERPSAVTLSSPPGIRRCERVTAA